MAGSQSLVSTTNTLTFNTSATTATRGPVVATVSLSISALVATPAQESVAQPFSASPEGFFFYLTRQRSRVAAKKAWVKPPKKTQRVRARKAVAKVVGIKEGGGGLTNLLLL